MQGIKPAVIGHKQVLENHPLVVEQLIGPGRALQGGERQRIAFKSIHASFWAGTRTRHGGIEADIGADIQDDRARGQKRAKDANNIVFVVPAKQAAKRLSVCIAKAEVFATAPAHEAPFAKRYMWRQSRHNYSFKQTPNGMATISEAQRRFSIKERRRGCLALACARRWLIARRLAARQKVAGKRDVRPRLGGRLGAHASNVGRV